MDSNGGAKGQRARVQPENKEQALWKSDIDQLKLH